MTKLENLLFLAAVAVLCWPHISSYTCDFHLHDTYFVIAFPKLLLTELLLVLFLFYKILRKRHGLVNRLMAVTHVFITILFIAGVLCAFVSVQTVNMSHGYLNYSNWQEIETQNRYRNLIAALFIIVFLITQFIFSYTLLSGLFSNQPHLTAIARLISDLRSAINNYLCRFEKN
jgi:heme/copper-type cytochrome/quinol oxidase subunit 1